MIIQKTRRAALALMAFAIVGGAVGLALRDGTIAGLLIALPVLVGGFLVVGALILLWRAACDAAAQ